MISFIKKRKELILVLLLSLIITILLYFLFNSRIIDIFSKKDVNGALFQVGLILVGFVLTAYTIFIGINTQLSKEIRETESYRKINARFLISIILNLLLIILGLLFLFYNNSLIIFLEIFLTIFSFGMLILILVYLNIMFKNISKNKNARSGN